MSEQPLDPNELPVKAEEALQQIPPPPGLDEERGHKYKVAYMFLPYASVDGFELEYIWNSRDAEVPQYVDNRDGTKPLICGLIQVSARYAPDFKPKIGDRVFISCNLETARAQAKMYVNRHWDQLSRQKDFPKGRRAAYDLFTQKYYGNGNAPLLVVVTRQLQEQFGWVSESAQTATITPIMVEETATPTPSA